MFDPNSFETDVNDEPVTVEITHSQRAHNGGWDEPPEPEEIEFTVTDTNGAEVELDKHYAAHIEREALEHLKWAEQEVELERRLSAMEAI